MTTTEKLNEISKTLCNVDDIERCPYYVDGMCSRFNTCRVREKTEEQLNYILSPNNQCTYLEACAGSGKTEALGMKAAYEICNWEDNKTGIAVLTFTNEAAATIVDRVSLFYPHQLASNHFIGTFTSFVHGYIAQKFGSAIYHKTNTSKDLSFRIIESSVKIYDNQWLNNYSVDFPLPPAKKLYANQLSFHRSTKSWYIHSGDHTISLREFYDQPDIQNLLAEIRQRKKKPDLFQFNYLRDQVLKCKEIFWNAGFATFEDMNMIASLCLAKEPIRNKLAQRFPLILIDECQDLSAMELRILKLLQQGGSNIHFIGDLNQAIYSFKDAFPEVLTEHIQQNGFEKLQLSNNFRSTQKIVDVSSKIQGISTTLTGNESSLFDGNDALYFEYDNECDVVRYFEEHLRKVNIDFSSAIVLTRNSNHKNLLSTSKSVDYFKHPIINAIQLWNTNEPNSRKKALQLIGFQIQKWAKTNGRSDSYYCPTDLITVYQWRLTLRDILNDLSSNPTVYNFQNTTYSAWYQSAKSSILEIVDNQTLGVFQRNITAGISLRAPKGTASSEIEIITLSENSNVKVQTIHAVKGCSYEAVLLVSTPNATGKAGYWENWINDKQETTRMAYVACTRPKHLLCWAVPKLNDVQRASIESLGFSKLHY